MPSKNIEFSMAILCYRAEEKIIPFVKDLYAMMSMFRFEWELILIANYWPESNDKTPEIVKKLAAELEMVHYLTIPKKGGMGWDMKMGLDECKGRYIGIIDGDGQFPVEVIFSCFAKIRTGMFDFVKTYRVARSDGMYRKVISGCYNLLFKCLFPAYRGYHDVNSKPKIITQEAYSKMNLQSNDWFIDAEMVLKAIENSLRIYEIPVNFESIDRPSFVKTATAFEYLKNILYYRFKGIVG